MDSSRRAVESYWRSRMIDGATSDEDKVTPVYKLEEICELLRSSHVSIVKEVSEFILKRLDHKSPIVKQKALRLIKYAVGKSGVEFRREMQRNSVAVRQLFHYKGQPDPLKGDALNKAVRDTAHEAISAIFAEDNNNTKPSPADDLNKRIQGFGNTNFEMPSDDKKSFLSEVVGIGSASIKQGISSFTQGHSLRKNDNGNYKSPTLRRSLTTESDHSDRYEPVELRNDTQGVSKITASGPWGQDSKVLKTETTNGEASSNYSETKTREERLLETIVTSGGVRLQPTRDAIQAFLVEAAKLDALALSHALESKLLSPMWQVRMKAVCVLESILRRKEDEHFLIVASYFTENKDVVLRCSESPQTSLREKANKVLILLNGEQTGGLASNSEKSLKAETTPVQMPDLIDTGGPDDYTGLDNSTKNQHDQNIANLTATPLIDDLFGDGLDAGLSTSEQKNDDDPFADVSFHTDEGRENVDDLFSGMTIDDKSVVNGNHAAANIKSELIDIFGTNSEAPFEPENKQNDVNDLMVGLSMNENSSSLKQKGISSEAHPENIFADINTHSSHEASNDALSGTLGSQAAGMNTNPMFPLGTMPYSFSPGIMLNPAFSSQPMNYGAMGSFFAQQQLLATMSNLQHLANLNAQNAAINHVSSGSNGGYSSALPDIFQSNFPIQTPSSMMNSSKKEDTRAFDFISDHLAAARDPKRTM
ncbi:PREDICTED: VHS domain-containing protein At3g16270 [Theobroma cacao]|uniref:VHS domain-containing protein At3g16270 n=2 Tax=Theobroma cacao TaxID=3641 RepID=A0AB32WME0_THECC|nr:PREDICTED: VHS domain-containing protein At3g16270 [Theobroma cacao]EOY26876.1 VHS domain-containing protein [Theobroma cacao]